VGLAAGCRGRVTAFRLPHNGWVVEALQAAWSAIATTPIPQDDPPNGIFRVDHLRLALDAAVRGGNDTDTVAAIAGGLLGAAYGASAVPAGWRRILHGWPGMRTRDLVVLVNRVVKAEKPFSYDVEPKLAVRHPHDDGVWLGSVSMLWELPPGVDAVVSLCRVPIEDLPMGVEQIDVRLIDQPGVNNNLHFVLTDTVRLIEQLRSEGRSVFLHCVAAQSRTPTVAALYGARRRGISGQAALQEVTSVLQDAYPNSDFLPSHRRAGTMTMGRPLDDDPAGWPDRNGSGSVGRDLGRLVLTIVELLRQLMERQALRRVDVGDLPTKPSSGSASG
jgi:ADP-ribosyl-[dinitrogen reductase] hydrolase